MMRLLDPVNNRVEGGKDAENRLSPSNPQASPGFSKSFSGFLMMSSRVRNARYVPAAANPTTATRRASSQASARASMPAEVLI